MAIGDYPNSNSNQSNKSSDTTYYSRFRLRAKDGKRQVSFTYWSGLLVISIDDVDSSNGYKVNPLEIIRLSPNKAKILAHELRLLKEYMKEKTVDPNKAFGVNSGLGQEVPYIGFSAMNNEERSVVITIGKINGSGDILSSQTFVIEDQDDFWSGLEWNDITSMDVMRNPYKHLEFEMIIDMLDSFAKYMNGALAYSVLDLGRYDTSRMNKRFDALYDKLGIEKFTPGNGRYNGGGSNNFLNNLAASNRSSNSTTLESLEDMLDD